MRVWDAGVAKNCHRFGWAVGAEAGRGCPEPHGHADSEHHSDYDAVKWDGDWRAASVYAGARWGRRSSD
jgi:hypothetical protein